MIVWSHLISSALPHICFLGSFCVDAKIDGCRCNHPALGGAHLTASTFITELQEEQVPHFSITYDIKDAHRTVVVDEADWGLQGCALFRLIPSPQCNPLEVFMSEESRWGNGIEEIG